ncbi:MAG: MBOAT family protein [Oscillospiraceae bacterium]|nr:MBOAT family protein [Oscillospiraceae bacterium]
MMFSSIPFLYYFLPAVLFAYFAIPWIVRKITGAESSPANLISLRNAILLTASVIFYAWGGAIFLLLIFGLTVNSWLWGLLIDWFHNKDNPKSAKVALIISIVTGLSGLAYFKYTDFFLTQINWLTPLDIPLTGVIVPIGISFYTFQILSYNIDLYRRDVAVQKSVFRLATYITLFPQLVAGPIVRYSDIEPALHERKVTFENFSSGLSRFTVGLGKKVIIGNTLGEMLHVVESSGEKSVLSFLLLTAGFALQIYFDFSGYSDMAIGLGRVFGFKIIENFNYPYISKSVTEFWRRWHISLGLWLRDYVYIPLGGNRKRQWLNILVVWTLIGFLQGAAWNFILWGLYFVVVLLIEKNILRKYLRFDDWHKIARHIYTLTLILCSFMLFRSNNIFESESLYGQFSLYYLQSYAVLLLICVIGATKLPKRAFNRFLKPFPLAEPMLVALCLIISTAFLVDGTFNPFIYFRF